jgi:hypothetical protein
MGNKMSLNKNKSIKSKKNNNIKEIKEIKELKEIKEIKELKEIGERKYIEKNNDDIMEQYYELNSKIHGLYIKHYKNINLRYECEYDNGKLIEEKIFSYNILSSHNIYKSDKLYNAKYYDYNEKIIYEYTYLNNMMINKNIHQII